MYLPKNQDFININRKKGKKRELNFIEQHNIIVLSKNVKTKKSVEASRLAFSVAFFEILFKLRRIFMLYEINFDNTKNIKLNENIFNCSIKIAILNKTFNAGLIKEEKYQEEKQNILQKYNLTHIGI